MENMRRCPRCGQDKPEADFRRTQPYCRPCISIYKKERYAASPAVRAKAIKVAKESVSRRSTEVKAYQDAYREANREKLRVTAVDYRQRKATEISEREKLRAATPKRREWARVYRRHRMETDPEFRARIAAYGRKAARKWYRRNRASILETAKAAYWADPDASRAKIRRSLAVWRAAHPDVLAAIQSRRKALRRGAVADGFDDAEHYRFLESWQQGCCYHCSRPYGSYHRDHLVPILYKGTSLGRHEAGNLALSCAYCNTSKHAKLLWQEWQPSQVDIGETSTRIDGALVVSTFWASERGGRNASNVVKDLRIKYPDEPLFFDWELRNRPSAVANMLSARDGSAKIASARKTQVVEVDTAAAQVFLDRYHLQGFGRGTVYLGLVHADELVAVSAWLELDGAIELNRLAFKGRVVGGFGKLLSAFKREFLPTGCPLLSFVDPRYGDGHSYDTMGFRLAGETAAPVYYYVGPGGMFHRRLFTKDAMSRRLAFFDPALSERDNAMANGYYRLFGLRQKRFMFGK